ncbi:MAG: GNAT family N-acetyltransferase [Phycisphaerales bacterium]
MITPPGQRAAEEQAWPIRHARPEDRDRVLELFQISQSDGMADANDAADDLRDMAAAYLDAESGSRFWVVEDDAGRLVGMVGVRRHSESQAAVRRLHVHPERRMQGIGSLLVREALRFCHDQGYVKIVLETKEDQTAAIALFTRFGFRLNRAKDIAGVKKLEFYIDLYYKPDVTGPNMS